MGTNLTLGSYGYRKISCGHISLVQMYTGKFYSNNVLRSWFMLEIS